VSATSALIYAAAMAATVVNAASAVLETEDKRMDLVGALTVGFATSLGGGTLRDLLLDRPVFWIGDINYLVCCLLTVVGIFALARRIRIRPGLFVIPDAVGLALYTIVGCQIALAYDIHWLPASLLGLGETVSALAGGSLVLLVRLASIRYQLSLPTYKSR
jgi:uncharacterized membrane protein YeiH